MAQLGDLIACRVPALRNAFGAIDGSIFAIPRSTNHEEQRRYYNGHKSKHAAKCLFVFGPDGAILWVASNFPGCWHDSLVADYGDLYDLIRNTVPPGRYLLADTAFQRMPGILSTVDERTSGNVSTEDAIVLQAASTIVSKARILVEWSIGGLKKTFRILEHKLVGTSRWRDAVFRACFQLWNFRVRLMNCTEVPKVFCIDEALHVRPHAHVAYNVHWST
jgi:hypothetical protein